MRINSATVESPHDEPAGAFVVETGDTADPKATSLNISDTTIVVIEKRSLVRECLAACIASQSGNRVVSFPNVEAYLVALGVTPASLVLLCQSTNSGSAAEVQDLDRLTRLMPQLPVVVLSDAEDLQQIRAAIELRRAWLYSDQSQIGGGRGGTSPCASRGSLRASEQPDYCFPSPRWLPTIDGAAAYVYPASGRRRRGNRSRQGQQVDRARTGYV